MEESEKRRERLKAMRMEAAQGDVKNFTVSHGLSNPLIETSTTHQESSAPPRFDYYTDPMSAFSGNKRSKVRQNISQEHFTPPTCKYLRRRCPSDCIFSPYFPSNNPKRFACVHRIYGASNIGKMLQLLPVHLRAEAADSLYYEAQCRIENPAYGCVGIITSLHEQINNTQMELAKVQVDIAFRNHSHEPGGGGGEVSQHDQQRLEPTNFFNSDLPEQNVGYESGL